MTMSSHSLERKNVKTIFSPHKSQGDFFPLPSFYENFLLHVLIMQIQARVDSNVLNLNKQKLESVQVSLAFEASFSVGKFDADRSFLRDD
jgi:hypothetical protein